MRRPSLLLQQASNTDFPDVIKFRFAVGKSYGKKQSVSGIRTLIRLKS